MSAETIAIVLSAVGIVVTLGVAMFAGFSWCIRRTDELETKLTTRIDGVETRLTTRIDGLEARLSGVAADTTELKIAVARIEGPPRHLIVASR